MNYEVWARSGPAHVHRTPSLTLLIKNNNEGKGHHFLIGRREDADL